MMKNSFTYKTKQFALLAGKILIISLAFYFIYSQLKTRTDGQLITLITEFEHRFSVSAILILFLFSFLNWFLEILKWQNLVSFISKISFFEATKQTLSGMTLSVFTPNGIGDYGAKILYYDRQYTPTILMLNFLANGVQMAFTNIFGLLGLLYFVSLYTLPDKLFLILSVTLGSLVLLIALMYFFRKQEFWGFSIEKTIHQIRCIPTKIHLKNALYGILRFAVFCHQYYFIFFILNVPASYFTLLCTLFVMYLITSIIPSFQLFDVAIKGSVGMYLFNLLGINVWYIVFASSLMWVFNYILPSIIGSFFVLKYQYKWK